MSDAACSQQELIKPSSKKPKKNNFWSQELIKDLIKDLDVLSLSCPYGKKFPHDLKKNARDYPNWIKLAYLDET